MKDQLFKPVSNSRGVVSCKPEQEVPAASEFIGKLLQTKNWLQINNRAYVLNMQWHNQRLKLTEKPVSYSPREKKNF